MNREKVNVIALQETHTKGNEDISNRGFIPT